MGDLKWGGEDVADVVIMASWPWRSWTRDGPYKLPEDVERDADGVPLKDRLYLLLMKARHGVLGTCVVGIDEKTGRIFDLDDTYQLM